jgi:hypothetical protein
MPLTHAKLVLGIRHEDALDLYLGAKKVSPLIPSGVPNDRHHRLVETNLQSATAIAVDSVVVIEIHLAQGCAETPLLDLGAKGQDATGKEGSTVARSLSVRENRAEAAVREHHLALRIGCAT